MKRTPLYETHRALGGKLIEFGGWEMPVQYSGIADEHHAVRNAAGMFDISHMGEVSVEGPAAQTFLNRVLTNDIRKLQPGTGQYTLMCNDAGGTVDDLYAYCLAPQKYLLIVNASRTTTDFAWLESQARSSPEQADLTLRNISDVTAAVAVQGPAVAAFINRCFDGQSCGGMPVQKPADLKKNQVAEFAFADTRCWVARTGYTGEDGFEVVAPARTIVAVWNKLLQEGSPEGLKPAGLGARDTLRTEMCYPLYGHELSEHISPVQAGLGFFVSFDKGDFVGREALLAEKSRGVNQKLVAFRLTERGAPPRPEYPVFSPQLPSEQIGKVVSGSQSPSLNVGIGLAYVQPAFSRPETSLQIEVRGRRYAALVVPKPIYRKP